MEEEEEEEEEEDKMPNHAATWFREGGRGRRADHATTPHAHTQRSRLKLREDTFRVKGVCSLHAWVDALHKLNISEKFLK